VVWGHEWIIFPFSWEKSSQLTNSYFSEGYHFVAQSGAHIFTISVDLCMQRQHADLATPGALKWWRDRAASGQLVSVGGGPPCETYTAARYHVLEGTKGPRPLRSAEEPTGLPGLTSCEQLQIWIGDSLLRFLIDLLSIMAALGFSGFLEHPQYPVWSRQFSPASIWAMPAVKLLKRLQCFAVVSFDQCTCGALGKKPTTLLLLRLPQVRSELLRKGLPGHCPHHTGTHEALIGRQQDGQFQTASSRTITPDELKVLHAHRPRVNLTQQWQWQNGVYRYTTNQI